MYNSQTTAFRFEARNFTELELLSYKIAKCQSKLMVWVYPKEVSKGHCGLRKRATPQTLDLGSKASYYACSKLKVIAVWLQFLLKPKLLSLIDN